MWIAESLYKGVFFLSQVNGNCGSGQVRVLLKFPFEFETHHCLLLFRGISVVNISPQFKRKKLLTRPVLKFLEGKANYVRIEKAIYLGRQLKSDVAADGSKKKEPAHIAEVVDLQTGELAQIIVAAMVLSVLNEEYPSEGYVGKCFSITKQGKVPGKQYFGYNVEEIEDPTVQPAKEAETSAPVNGTEASAARGTKSRAHVST